MTTKSFSVAPQWTKKPQALFRIKEGSYLDIECSARGEPEPMVTVVKKQGRAAALVDSRASSHSDSPAALLTGIEWLKMSQFKENHLKTQATRQDSGSYKCRADNGIEPTVETEFEVQVSGTDFLGPSWSMF